MVQLEYLDLSSNNITYFKGWGSLVGSYYSLEKLQVLIMNNNEIDMSALNLFYQII